MVEWELKPFYTEQRTAIIRQPITLLLPHSIENVASDLNSAVEILIGRDGKQPNPTYVPKVASLLRELDDFSKYRAVVASGQEKWGLDVLSQAMKQASEVILAKNNDSHNPEFRQSVKHVMSVFGKEVEKMATDFVIAQTTANAARYILGTIRQLLTSKNLANEDIKKLDEEFKAFMGASPTQKEFEHIPRAVFPWIFFH